MAYEKPTEIQITSHNLAGTEAKSVEALMKLERLLTKTLATGDIFKSPAARINTSTHDVTKSLFVRNDVVKLVTDTLLANQDLFVAPLKIASKEAKTKKYKVEVEGDRAIASLHSNTASLGGRVYGNQHGNYIEIPSYKGSLKGATNDAIGITKNVRAVQEKEKKKEEEKEAQEAIRKQKAEEKEKAQKEKEKEKEDKQAETDSKHRGIAVLAGISGSVLLLRKLIQLVEKIVTGVLDASAKAYNTTMDAAGLNLDPVVLRNLSYAGMAKGVGDAPIEALRTMQSSFGSTLLAAENIGKLDIAAPILGNTLGTLLRNGQAGTDPLGMTSAVLDSFMSNYQEGKDEFSKRNGTDSANAASMASILDASFGPAFSKMFLRMVADDDAGLPVTSFQEWITGAMPISSPTNAQEASASESYKAYIAAFAEFKSVVDLLKISLSPVLDRLTVVLERLNGYLLRLSGNTTAVAEMSMKNHEELKTARTRDKAELTNIKGVEDSYLEENKNTFPTVSSFDTAVEDFQRGVLPKGLSTSALEEFKSIALLNLYKKRLESNIGSYDKEDADYLDNITAYTTGEETFAFTAPSIQQTFAAAEGLHSKALSEASKVSKNVEPTYKLGSLDAAYQRAVDKQRQKDLAAEKKAKIKQLAMDLALPQLTGDVEEQEFAYYNLKSKEFREQYEELARKSFEVVELHSNTPYGEEDVKALIAETLATQANASALAIISSLGEKAIPKDTDSINVYKDMSGTVTVKFLDSKDKTITSVNVPFGYGLGAGENVTIENFNQAE